ncbi:MAG: hypothetical protein JHC26_12790 [Thermofilum sp.]|nr:hypothetical protein [Thermofilum sp.]
MEKGKEGNKKTSKEKLKYSGILNPMEAQTQISKNSEENGKEICARVIGVYLPAEFGEPAREVINVIAYVVNRMYNPYIVACVKGSTLTVDIYNQYIDHIDICHGACYTAVEALGCEKEGYIDVCYKRCRQVVREESFKALYESIKNIEAELRLRRLKYKFELDKESPPQHVKFIIKL